MDVRLLHPVKQPFVGRLFRVESGPMQPKEADLLLGRSAKVGTLHDTGRWPEPISRSAKAEKQTKGAIQSRLRAALKTVAHMNERPEEQRRSISAQNPNPFPKTRPPCCPTDASPAPAKP